jgi:hypothetical protein
MLANRDLQPDEGQGGGLQAEPHRFFKETKTALVLPFPATVAVQPVVFSSLRLFTILKSNGNSAKIVLARRMSTKENLI